VLLRDHLLRVMDQKHHWAYPALTKPGLTRDQLIVHFRHEYLVYVRDFPVLLARALGVTPSFEDVRSAVAENLYEEQTGGLSGTASHPRLFLRMMAGLDFDAERFVDDDGWLHPSALRYRDFLHDRSASTPWQAALALLTVFVEGSVNERAELEGKFVRPRGEAAVQDHPLVKHYGCPTEAMDLTRAHAQVEGSHRKDAWGILLAHVPEGSDVARAVVDTCEQALAMWHAYRDGVADRMRLRRRAA
jgi:pyrroloquinoline quinone (PQQ) biosynthesis protein C